MYDETSRQTEVGFALRKGFYLTPHIRRVLLKLIQTGYVNEVFDKWFYFPVCSTYKAEDQKFQWFYFGGILLFLSICFGFSIFVNLLENLYTFVKNKPRLKTTTEASVLKNHYVSEN